MKNIKSTYFFKPLLFTALSFIVFAAPVNAKDQGNSSNKDKKHETKWPKKNDNVAWDDEEFANDGLCDEINTEKEIVIDFQYLLKCLK